MVRLPLNVLTLYADLLQQLQSASQAGTLYTQKISGHTYQYVRWQAGQKRLDRLLGRADHPETAKAASRIRAENQLRKQRRKLIAALRKWCPPPHPGIGSVLDAVADAGLFKNGAVLVGTAAYLCYGPLVGAELPAAALITQDVDIATAKLALQTNAGLDSGHGGSPAKLITMETILKRADESFGSLPGLDPRAMPSRFRAETGLMVDLLTPLLRRTDRNPMRLPHLRAGAAPLQYLKWLLEDPVDAIALHGSGVLVSIPQPARFAVHKLIIAQKRPGANLKRQKDLLQAKALMEALSAHDPEALELALADAKRRGSEGWRRPITASLEAISRMER